MSQNVRKWLGATASWRAGITAIAAVLAVSAISALQTPLPPAAPGGTVTFTKDIAPILQKHCQTCHRPDSIAPMSLITYEDVRPWARSVKSRTGLGPHAGVMPPWYAEKGVGIQEYENDPSLSDQEIQAIARWVDSGAPQGNPADMPPPLTFSDDWTIGTPDLIVESPIVEMQPTGSDWWGDLAGDVPTGLTEDRYVAALQMREVTVSMDGGAALKSIGGRFIIHHWSVRTRNPGTENVNLGEGERPPDGVGSTHEVGRNADVYDADAGRLVKAGAVVHFGTAHLHPNGRHTKARLLVGFKFHPRGWQPARQVRARGLFGNSFNLDIRPMEANQKFEGFTVLQDNARIVSFEPHMHAAGVRMCLDAIYGSGTTAETLSCVGYDHSWVRTYAFKKDSQPLLPRGTIMRITGYFDNTPANHNVVDPRNWSGNGHRSIDNMMNELGEVELLTDKQFQDAMLERRHVRGLQDGETMIGCPLCGVVGKIPARTVTGQQN
jgi:hypothetical protein